jgi:hypothetical protein
MHELADLARSAEQCAECRGFGRDDGHSSHSLSSTMRSQASHGFV